MPPDQDSPLVICVDDVPQVSALHERWLTARGFRVRICTDGAELLDLLKTVTPDLILLDMNMPVMSGPEVLMSIRSQPRIRHLPVVVVSANGSENQIAQGLSAGANDYLVKPIQMPELVAKINSQLKRSPANDATGGGIRHGAIVGRHYMLQAVIAQGATSRVYRAIDRDFPVLRYVAIKVLSLSEKQRRDPLYLRLFTREVSVQSRLDHPNIVRMLDFGQDAGRYFMAMEHLEGHSLDRILDQKQAMTESMAVGVGLQVAGALSYLATLGMIHRDICPANIFLLTSGQVKIIDFGFAKKVAEETLGGRDGERTTVAYLAPEMIQRQQFLDTRSDVYALGATLFHLSTGRPPFPGDNMPEVIQAHIDTRPPRMRSICPQLSEAYDELVDRMLIKDPEQRIELDEAIAQLARLSEE